MKTTGFTIVEIIIVVVILGVVAALAIPRFIASSERSICSEAINALSAFRDAQARYYLDRNTYDNGSCTNLDIDITPKNFNSLSCDGSTGDISLTRIGGSYTATAHQSAGTIYSCSGGGCTASVIAACFTN